MAESGTVSWFGKLSLLPCSPGKFQSHTLDLRKIFKERKKERSKPEEEMGNSLSKVA